VTAEQDAALATTPADELLALRMLQPDQVTDSLHAYQLAKRANSLRVMAEAVRWGKRGARINTISPGIVITPLAKDELTGPSARAPAGGYSACAERTPDRPGERSAANIACQKIQFARLAITPNRVPGLVYFLRKNSSG